MKNSLFLKLLEESYNTKINKKIPGLLAILIITLILSLYYQNDINLYNKISKLFSNLSTIYSILIGFNISSVIFIVSFIFKESIGFKKLGNEELRLYYSQIINSFMLSTINNLSIILLGINHYIVVDIIKNKVLIILPNQVVFLMDIFYIWVWFFLILTSVVIFSRCLLILTRLLRVADIND